jgi:hypothetical protein
MWADIQCALLCGALRTVMFATETMAVQHWQQQTASGDGGSSMTGCPLEYPGLPAAAAKSLVTGLALSAHQ